MGFGSAITLCVVVGVLGAAAIAGTACSSHGSPGPAFPVDVGDGDGQGDAEASGFGFGDAGSSDPFDDACEWRTGTPVCSDDAGSSCPPSEPAEGEPCPPPAAGFSCTYGDSPAPSCHARVLCDPCSLAWRHEGPLPIDSGTSACGSNTCPVDIATEAGVASSGADSVCSSPDGTYCVCGGTHWECSPPPRAVGCPATLPNEGVCCDPAVVSTPCDYGRTFGNCGGHQEVSCDPKRRTFVWLPSCVVGP